MAAPAGQFYLRRDRGRLVLLLVPALLLVVGVQLYPLLYAAWLSFQDWTLTRTQEPQGFVGLSNYTRILSDSVFRGAVRNTLIITLTSVPAQLVIGTALAYLTIGSNRTLRGVRTFLIIPMVVAPVAIGTLWRMLFNAQAGPINNHLLAPLGIEGPVWLGHPTWALVSVIIVEIWQWTPFVLLVVAAGVSSIPDELRGAAYVDGASAWQAFRHIDLPLLTPVFLVIIMFRGLESLITLDIIFSLTRGGPGFSTFNLTYYIYILGLRNFNLGGAAAASWLFMIGATLIIIILFRWHLKKEV